MRRGSTTTYAYDAINRLTEVDTTGNTTQNWSYVYDNASNRTRRTHDGQAVTFAYDPANELCWRADGAHTPTAGRLPAAGRAVSCIGGGLSQSLFGVNPFA